MDTQKAYDLWATQYDTNQNRTRDLEGIALRTILADLSVSSCLEIGCGTGKNTAWFVERAPKVTAVDLSQQMLSQARQKVISDKVQFVQADITEAWTFGRGIYDLVSFSLVLEHVADLSPVFREASLALVPGGHVYVGELHPFKQYAGTKARFDTPEGRQVVDCFNHHVSDFVQAAHRHSLRLVNLQEFFDEDDRSNLPRILSLVFQKQV